MPNVASGLRFIHHGMYVALERSSAVAPEFESPRLSWPVLPASASFAACGATGALSYSATTGCQFGCGAVYRQSCWYAGRVLKGSSWFSYTH